MTVKYKRKNYLVNKSFQFRFIIKVFFSVFIMIGLLATGILYVNTQSLKISGKTAEVGARSFLQQHKIVTEPGEIIKNTRQNLTSNIIIIFLLTVVITAVMVGVIFLIFTHRIAGPVYRVQQTIIKFGAGNLASRVVLREKDEMQDIADAFNKTAVTICSDISQIKTILNRVRENPSAGHGQSDLNAAISILDKYTVADN
ncbi:MAG: hypothetical protein A2096_15640 [Spirochaetes bacterium GWF1_41_5]|nr:MAG: hypothetical protein A2096_15640 [Spirochaetes bacterium GWF1_41_5]